MRYLNIIDALEISVESENANGDLTERKVGWDLIDFDENRLRLQVIFEAPETISTELKVDTIKVTFYGVEFFSD